MSASEAPPKAAAAAPTRRRSRFAARPSSAPSARRWVRAADARGVPYWYARDTRETTWHDPSAKWVRMTAEQGPFWYSPATKVVTWVDPNAAVDEADAAEPTAQACALLRALQMRGAADKLRRAVETELAGAREEFKKGVSAEAKRIFNAKFGEVAWEVNQKEAFAEVQRGLKSGECMQLFEKTMCEHLRDGKLLNEVLRSDVEAIRKAELHAGREASAAGESVAKSPAVSEHRIVDVATSAAASTCVGSGLSSENLEKVVEAKPRESTRAKVDANAPDEKKKSSGLSLGAFMSSLKKPSVPMVPKSTPSSATAKVCRNASKAPPRPRSLGVTRAIDSAQETMKVSRADVDAVGGDIDMQKSGDPVLCSDASETKDADTSKGTKRAIVGETKTHEEAEPTRKKLRKNCDDEGGTVREAKASNISGSNVPAAEDNRGHRKPGIATDSTENWDSVKASGEIHKSSATRADAILGINGIDSGMQGAAGDGESFLDEGPLPAVGELKRKGNMRRRVLVDSESEGGEAGDDGQDGRVDTLPEPESPPETIGSAGEKRAATEVFSVSVQTKNTSSDAEIALREETLALEESKASLGSAGERRLGLELVEDGNAGEDHLDAHMAPVDDLNPNADETGFVREPESKEALVTREQSTRMEIDHVEEDVCALMSDVAKTNSVATPSTSDAPREKESRRSRRPGRPKGSKTKKRLRADRSSGHAALEENADFEGLSRVRKVLDEIIRLPAAEAFRRPVDSTMAGCEDYYQEIGDPMDLGTIMNRIPLRGRPLRNASGKYLSVVQVLGDVDLVWKNCFQYNPSGDDVCVSARECQAQFQILYEKEMDNATAAGEGLSTGRRRSGRANQGVPSARLRNESSDEESTAKRHLRRKKAKEEKKLKKRRLKEAAKGSEKEAVIEDPREHFPPVLAVSNPVKRPTGGPPGLTGALLIGRDILVFTCMVPGIVVREGVDEPVRFYQCRICSYNEADGTHCLKWKLTGEFTYKARFEEKTVELDRHVLASDVDSTVCVYRLISQ